MNCNSVVPQSATEEKKVLFDMEVVKKRLPVLTKKVDHDPDLELQVLFALQVVIHKHDIFTGQWKRYRNRPFARTNQYQETGSICKLAPAFNSLISSMILVTKMAAKLDK